MSGGGMVLHAGRRIERPGVIRTTTLCGRMNARSRDGMNIAGTDESVTCKFCLAKMRGPVPVPVATASAVAPVRPRPIARATALDLLQAIYRHHGWRRAEGESMVARVQALYTVSAEPGRNRYVATPKAVTTPGTALDRSPAPNMEPSDDL
ncbi:hypothetical protein [Xanthomonas euvesicatoria]|uniref:hypothetical protein n=1 Tax=Xanthomonas euvesicatoria TaxID=456327 RepID=UPI00080E308D|nr:hypothetical protein [Xanthomonas euvesicatoria]MCC8799094.1 hypothetical protein [Xanthomonas euvesicatoria pv. euvesicatoria]MCC8807699.1 hypothetical protein [Xanthomonas euvesicatoria pv. euvesicatoria]MCC8816144.1 hypothetical protein [Xanthomonas euvesicatoria pv. euvesicatoria]OCG92903.1 hypothetical protein XEULMG905_00390 [Xanthomonas euvesicatoria]